MDFQREFWLGNRGPVCNPSRIAVLPFANISPDPNDDYFADGLTEELIANLSLVPGLKVIARTSVTGYRKTEKKVATIGKELGVGTVVEGSVRRAANRIRVTVQVIDVATEEHLWTAKYDDDPRRHLRRPERDCEQGGEFVTWQLGRNQGARSGAPKPSETEAYLDFLQGQSLMWKPDEASLRRSIEHFQKAIRKDPGYARAYAGLSRAYIQLGNEGILSWLESIKLAKAAAEKAAALDPDLADAHLLLAEVAFMSDDIAGILDSEVRRALELNPNLSHAHAMLGNLAGSLQDSPNVPATGRGGVPG